MSISDTTELAPAFSPLLRQFSLEEFWRLPEPEGRAHYDLIGGNLFMVPPPDPPHGDVDSRLNMSLVAFLAANGIAGNVYHPREAIYLGNAAPTKPFPTWKSGRYGRGESAHSLVLTGWQVSVDSLFAGL